MLRFSNEIVISRKELVKKSRGRYNKENTVGPPFLRRHRGENVGNMTPLYGPEDIRRLEQKRTISAALCWLLGLGGLTVCVTLCALTNTGNARRMELLCIAVWVLAGWVLLYLRRFVLRESLLELQHARMLLQGDAEALHGRVRVTKERLRIVNSIRITMVELENKRNEPRPRVCAYREKPLRNAGEEQAIWLVNGYIAGYGPVGEGLAPPVDAAEQNRGS